MNNHFTSKGSFSPPAAPVSWSEKSKNWIYPPIHEVLKKENTDGI